MGYVTEGTRDARNFLQNCGWQYPNFEVFTLAIADPLIHMHFAHAHEQFMSFSRVA